MNDNMKRIWLDHSCSRENWTTHEREEKSWLQRAVAGYSHLMICTDCACILTSFLNASLVLMEEYALHGPNSQDLAIFFPPSFQEPLIMKRHMARGSGDENIFKGKLQSRPQSLFSSMLVSTKNTNSGQFQSRNGNFPCSLCWSNKKRIWNRSRFIVG